MRKNFIEKQLEFVSEGLQWENIESEYGESTALTNLEICMTALDHSNNDVQPGDDEVGNSSSKNMTKKENHQLKIGHYFGDVMYNAKSFREKNSTTIPHEYLQVFRSSSLSLLITLFPENEALAAKLQKKTLSISAQYKVCTMLRDG